MHAPKFPKNPATICVDNPTVDHLRCDFEQPPDNKRCLKQICQESAAVRHPQNGEYFISDHPCERNKLPQDIQEVDKTLRMAQSDNWEVVDLETKDMSSGMVVVMVEAEALEPTYEEARGWLDWLQWKDVIKVELEAL